MRSAHLLKGASANLMCGPLRAAALQLEEAARLAHQNGGVNASPEMQANVQTAIVGLQQAAQNYVAFVQTLGI